jgi:hypothetical protein
MFIRIQPLVLCAALSATTLMLVASCSSLPFLGDRSASSDPAPKSPPVEPAETASAGGDEAELRRIVEASVERANAAHEAARAQLIRKEPYFYKEYEYYPDGTLYMEVTTRETESRTAPLEADVQLRKQRFVTKLHRKKDEARADDEFLRDTGEETITYELRNGEWMRRSSMFVAESVEQNVDGVWVPVEEVERTDDPEGEEDLSWFGRVWATVVGPR